MLPGFDTLGGLMLPLARGLAVAALLAVFGSLVFRVFVIPRTVGAMPEDSAAVVRGSLLRFTRLGVAAGLLGYVAWLALQSADMAGAGFAGLLPAVRAVLVKTAYGHLIALQALFLLAVGVTLGRRDSEVGQRVALGFASAALGLQAAHSHAASMEPGASVLLASALVHLFGAGAWLGGLVPLLMAVRIAPAKAGALAARWFSPLGKLCLVGLTASSLYQGWVLIGSIPGLVGTAYGWMVLCKLGLFGVLFGFAVLNRYRLAPALLRHGQAGRRMLVRSIAVQTGFGLAVVAAAAVLSSLPPAMHEQPLWPFADRFTLDTIQEDPAFRTEVLGAVLALAGAAVLLVAAAVVRRRARWACVGAAAFVAWFAVPHLDLLFVPAYPTSFYRSPTGFAASAIAAGDALYPGHCASCHGAGGHGDGPAAKGLAVPPADLTAAHLWMHSDGELFWWLTHGIEAPAGGLAMPGFAAALSEDDRWDLIDFIRAHNAGAGFKATGLWPVPIRAPGFAAVCASGRTVSSSDLGGGFVRLVLGGVPPAMTAGVTTVLATSDPAARAAPGLCIAPDAAVARAYGVVAGLTASERPGAAFLIDASGWLRAVQPARGMPTWNDPAALQAAIQQLAAHPVANAPGGSHAQMQM